MKNLSKAFAVVLCIMLAVCMLAVTAAAEETTYAASVGETGYATVVEAVAAANGQTVKLLADSDETVTVFGDLYLDLNGYTLAGLTVTDGTLYGMDTTTDDYISYEDYGKITALTGSYAQYHQVEVSGNPQRYLAVKEDTGVSFHRFYLGITHQSLQPAASGVGYKALFCGDGAVKEQLDSTKAFGYTLHLDGYPSVSRWKSAEDFAAQKTLTLRVENYDVDNFGDTALYAAVQMKLADGTVITSQEQSATLKQMVETVNEGVAGYSTAQIDALSAWIKTSDTMLGWSVANILQEPISYDMNTGVNLVVYTELTGNLQSIAVKDTELTLANATLVNGVLTVPAASFRQEYMPSGRLTLIVTTDTEQVQYTGDFTWVIQDWGNSIGGLAYMEKHLVKEGNVYTGALALGADIDLTGKSISNFAMFKMANEFNGTFDGRNHTITGLKPAATTALFGTVGTNGVVENLKLTGVQITTYGGGVAYICKGTLRNIYVEGTITGDGMNAGSDLANFGSGLLAGIYNQTAKVDNCIVEVTTIADGLRLATAFGRMRTNMNESIFTYCNAVNADGYTFMQGTGDVDVSTWTKESFSWDYTNANFDTMSDLWKDTVAAALATQLGLENPNAPKDMELSESFDMNVTGNDLVVENTKLTGTLQSVAIQGTELTLANATLADGVLTVPAAAFVQSTIPSGNQTLIVKTDSEQIGINGDFVWVINTEAELLAMKNHLTANGANYDGLLALGSDINPSATGKDNVGSDGYVVFNKTYTAFANTDYFVGTFDGRNHTINHILANAATYGIFTNVGPAGVIKNLKVTNAYVKTNTAAVVGYRMQGTMENVYVHGQIDADGMGATSNLANFGNGLVAALIFDEARFNNCIVELATITDGLRLATAYGKLHEAGVESDVFTNCFAVNAADYTFMQYGTWTKQSFTAGGTNATYATMWELWQNDTAKALAQGFGLAEPAKPTVSYTFESFDMNTETDLVLTGTQIPKTVSVLTVKGTELQVGVAVVDGTVTVPAAQFVNRTVPMPTGELTLVAETDQANYEITGEFIWVIQDAAGLADMHKHLTADGTVYTGSLALGADLDMTNTNMANFTMFKSANTFNGSFDGRMHTISNMTPKANTALFGTLGAKGKVENLKLTGVTISTNGAGVTCDCYGTIENVYVEGSITADGMGANSNLGNFGCGLLAGRYRSSAKVNSCMVNLTSITEGLRLGTAFGKLQNGATEASVFANCYAIGAAGNTFSHYVGTEYVKADFTTGGSNANFAALEDLISSDDVFAIVLASTFGLITE